MTFPFLLALENRKAQFNLPGGSVPIAPGVGSAQPHAPVLVPDNKRMSEKGRQAMIEGTKCLKGWVVYGREEVSQRHD